MSTPTISSVGDSMGQKMKSFWDKPEGTTGMVFAVGGVLAIGWIMWNFSAHILQMLQNTIGIVVCGAALAGILYIAFDKKAQTLLFYLYKGAMKKLTSFFVNIDPIAMIESYIDTLKDNMLKMEKQITNLKQAITRLEREIESNRDNINKNMKTMSVAEKSNQKAALIVSARKAGRLKDSNITLEVLLQKLKVLYSVLCKMEEASGYMLEDIIDDVSVKKKEREAVLIGHSALKSAMSILKGDPDKKEIFDMAMESIATDVGNRIGEMERFMEMSESVITGIDIQKGIYEGDGLAMLQEWEDKGVSLLLGEDKASIVGGAYAVNPASFQSTVSVLAHEQKQSKYL